MPFVKYTGSVRSYAPRASISKSGMLSFNEGARKRFAMGDVGFCVLYYDEETRRIGIELVNDGAAEGARKIRQRETGCDVSAKSFLDYFDLGVKKTTTYRIERDEETGFLAMDLTDGRERGSSRRADGAVG